VKRCARFGNGFLNKIFGVLVVFGQLQRRAQQLSLIRERVAFETFRKLGGHPLIAIPVHLSALPSGAPAIYHQARRSN
jgi:hypothetical protein